MQLPRSINKLVTQNSPRRNPIAGSSRELVGTVAPRVAGKIFLGAGKLRVKAWDRALERLEDTQEAQLRRILETAETSEFGRRYGFKSIRSYDDYRRRVPIGDYDSFADDFARMRAGEPDVLTNNRVRYICESAGSSGQGKRKFLPMSDMQIGFQTGSGVDGVYRYIVAKNDDTFTQGFIVSVLPPAITRPEGPVELTNNPALMSRKLPLPSQFVYLPDRETMEIEDIDGKLDVIAENYLDHDVRTLTGTTCWFSILFDKLIEAAQRKGRKVEKVRELWPNLRFLVGGGVVADPYMAVLRDRVGREDIDLVDTYNATEGGIFAVTDYTVPDPGLLMIPDRGVFYEFVPLEEQHTDSPTRVPLWEVETGRDYIIHMSTVSGLYSYRLGDIVRFSSVWPHRMEYTGRLSGCLSVTQELTTHREVQHAMNVATERVASGIVDYTVGSELGVHGTAKGRYIVMAEFIEGREPRDGDAFVRAFDEAHQAQNRAYREARDGDMALCAPILVTLPKGSVKRFMKESGMTSLQTKFPRIVNEERRDRLRSYARPSTSVDRASAPG